MQIPISLILATLKKTLPIFLILIAFMQILLKQILTFIKIPLE